jgi:hypothetical protein
MDGYLCEPRNKMSMQQARRIRLVAFSQVFFITNAIP